MKHDLAYILVKEFPGRIWKLEGNDLNGLTILDDKGKITQENIDEADKRLDRFDYQLERKRFGVYPTLVDQLDNIWHDINENKLDKSGKFYSSILEVKNKYPKPEAV